MMTFEPVVTKTIKMELPKGWKFIGRSQRIPGYENYSIYDDGRVFSHSKKKFRKTFFSPQGYERVTFNQKQTKHFRIHRLVAQAFHPNKEGKPEVNHIDGIKSNNHYKNLEWVTQEENQKHAVDNGLMKIGSSHHWSVLNEDIVTQIKLRLDAGEPATEIGRALHLHPNTIFNIKHNASWKHVSIEGLHNPYI